MPRLMKFLILIKEFLDRVLYEQGSIDGQEHFVVLFQYI